MTTPAPVLSVRDLVVEVDSASGPVAAVDGVSFDVAPGEVVALVGESGSGKSLTMLAVMGLLPPGVRVASGAVLLKGTDLRSLTPRERRATMGRDMAMIFQDPMTTLNPVIRVGAQIAEMVRLHNRDLPRREVAARVVELVRAVGIPNPERRVRAYPHELSGGQRQRLMIAMATANDPELLIADEPTTALDVTIQASVMARLRTARERSGSSLVMVTHDLGLVAENADRVLVMYSGRLVEAAAVDDLFAAPSHPYTAGLIASVLSAETDVETAFAIPGQPPELASRPPGCAFAPRCSRMTEMGDRGGVCSQEAPPLMHDVACHFPLHVMPRPSPHVPPRIAGAAPAHTTVGTR